MKKTFSKILIVMLSMGSFSSCVDYLDIRPESEMILDQLWQKESDVEGVLLACYRSMCEWGFIDRVVLWGELRADCLTTGAAAGSSPSLKQINDVNILPTYGECSWAPFYLTINYCNTLLKYAPDVRSRDANFTESNLNVKQAEALAIRALCYFYLVRTFHEVPLVLEATVSDDQDVRVGKTSAETVLRQITADLLQAEQWALNEYPTTAATKGRMTKDAIRALLADVYLWQKDYQNCITYCDKLIDAKRSLTSGSGSQPQGGGGNHGGGSGSGSQTELPKYQLYEEDISQYIFDQKNSRESIFELQFSTDVTNGAIKVYTGSSAFYGDVSRLGKFVANPAYADGIDVFAASDTRKMDFIKMPKADNGEYQIFKYLGYHRAGTGIGQQAYGQYSFNQATCNWIFYRISDIMLMKAEALAELGSDDNEVIVICNKTYMRANPTLLPVDSLSLANMGAAKTLKELVLLERQRELMFEGKRWFDLVRLAEREGKTTKLVEHVIKKYDDIQTLVQRKLEVMNAIYLPIPQGEIEKNKPLLKQNPYYETSSNIEKK